MRTKDPLDFWLGIARFGSNDGFAECIHVAISPLDEIL